ncbi:MAG: RNA polymerase [Flavobacteriaceae bacterium]|nr:RNA polymerase [Flavobacteriaceae bacterium]HBY67565.1 RNA polymerase [Flavobacteriaceae bacterium]|tara:strand:+ start:16 stop:603 length:588 start_codon:yes stop_codon:yes gene_type:complete
MNTTNDQYYITQTLQGNTQAYANLVTKYQNYVFTILIRMLKNREEAEEVAQDTFVKAFEALSTFRGESKFSSWLYSIAYRKALDTIRKNKRFKTTECIEEYAKIDFRETENALTYLEDKERKDFIENCIMQLPEDNAAIITLYYFDELSVKEIAVITKLTEDNIKIKLYRSRKKLFTLLKEYIQPEIANTNGKAI